MDSDKDVPSTVPSLPSAPSTSAATNVSAHCTCRMSSLKYDKHSLCVACRDVKCSVDVRCSECCSWVKDFMLAYVKHQRSLVSKGKKESSASSPSVPVTAVTIAPVVSLPNLPVSTEDQLRQYVYSVLANLLSQSGSLGTNLTSTAPPAVPDSAPISKGAAGGLVTLFGVPTTASPGVVLPTFQEDLSSSSSSSSSSFLCLCVCAKFS